MCVVRRAALAVVAVTVFALSLLVNSLAAEGQSSARVYRIGVLTAGGNAPLLRQSLRDLGYIEGRNVVFDIGQTEGKPERVQALATEFAQRKVDLIVATYPGAVFAAKRATTTIPIVMVNTPDPVQLGLVVSLSNPGGNVTGTTSLSVEVSIKQLQILKDVVPDASRIAVLWNPDNPWHPIAVAGLRNQNRLLGVHLQILELRNPNEFDAAFAAMVRERAHAVLILADPMMMAPANRERLAELAIKNHLPSIGGLRGYSEAGGLLSYWADEAELYQRVASHVERILKGASPDRLPIEQPTKFELLINSKTAKALRLTIPSSVLIRATMLE